MTAIFELQHWLYEGALSALKSLADAGAAGLPALIATAFGFGMLHALLPGHGKALLTSHYAGLGKAAGAIASSALLIVTHVGSAIALVLAGSAILQRTIGSAGRAPVLETSSHVLIVLIGSWMLWSALRQRPHGEASGPALALVAGLVPCPLTTFIMTYAVANGLLAAGLVLSGTFALGMIVTLAIFPLLAVLFRTRLLPVLIGFTTIGARIARFLAVAAAVAIIFLGAVPLIRD